MASTAYELPAATSTTITPSRAAPAVPYYSPAPGQPFQPFTGDYSEAELLPKVYKKWEQTKIVLHVMGFVFSVLGFILTGPLLADPNLPFDFQSMVFLDYAPLGLILVWDSAELITRAKRKWKSGIHPGAHVGLSLIIWLVSIFFFFVMLGALLHPQTILSNDCAWSARTENSYSQSKYIKCINSGHKNVGITRALSVFIFLCALVHFILFVGACVDTNKRNRAAKRPDIVMVTHPQFAIQGWTPLPADTPLPSKLSAANQVVDKEASGTIHEFYAPAHSAV